MDYTKCNVCVLLEHLNARLPKGTFEELTQFQYRSTCSRDVFQDEMESFVAECNSARECADGYELCEDYHGDTGLTVYYVMCEDGTTMATLSVFLP